MQSAFWTVQEYEALLKFMLFMNKLMVFGTGHSSSENNNYNFDLYHRNYNSDLVIAELNCAFVGQKFRIRSMVKKTYIDEDNVRAWNSDGTQVLILHKRQEPLMFNCKMNDVDDKSVHELHGIPLNTDEIDRVSFTYNLLHSELNDEFICCSLILGQSELLEYDCLIEFEFYYYQHSFVKAWDAFKNCYGDNFRYRSYIKEIDEVKFKK